MIITSHLIQTIANLTLKYGKQTTRRLVTGAWPEFGPMRNLIPQFGSRFINDRDLKERRRVMFIGDLLKVDLFGDSTAVGKRILVNGMPFVVIGVMATAATCQPEAAVAPDMLAGRKPFGCHQVPDER